MVQHVCEWCGKEFERFPSRQGRFCSRRCAGAFGCRQLKPNSKRQGRGGKITWVCKWCGKEMYTFKSRVKIYCSPKCWGKSIFGKSKSGYGTAKKNGSYRGENWQSQRNKARIRDEYRCQICGDIALDVHHIKKYKSFAGDWLSANIPSNLITLCELHHAQTERGKIVCPIPGNRWTGAQ